MARSDIQFKLRLDPELHQRVQAAAKSAGRSLNAEILSRLEAGLANQPDKTVFVVDDNAIHAFVEALLKESNVIGRPDDTKEVQINITRRSSSNP